MQDRWSTSCFTWEGDEVNQSNNKAELKKQIENLLRKRHSSTKEVNIPIVSKGPPADSGWNYRSRRDEFAKQGSLCKVRAYLNSPNSLAGSFGTLDSFDGSITTRNDDESTENNCAEGGGRLTWR